MEALIDYTNFIFRPSSTSHGHRPSNNTHTKILVIHIQLHGHFSAISDCKCCRLAVHFSQESSLKWPFLWRNSTSNAPPYIHHLCYIYRNCARMHYMMHSVFYFDTNFGSLCRNHFFAAWSKESWCNSWLAHGRFIWWLTFSLTLLLRRPTGAHAVDHWLSRPTLSFAPPRRPMEKNRGTILLRRLTAL